jgi:hypothetical protein
MTNLSNEIRELSIDALDAVIGAGQTGVSPNEQILAHFLSIHERTKVGTSMANLRSPVVRNPFA